LPTMVFTTLYTADKTLTLLPRRDRLPP